MEGQKAKQYINSFATDIHLYRLPDGIRYSVETVHQQKTFLSLDDAWGYAVAMASSRMQFEGTNGRKRIGLVKQPHNSRQFSAKAGHQMPAR
ncbi:MAG: hypothetical protein KTR14_02815 [Vampirovibrio sp.]|nr:hypothetical protein [Vampirovibrio sp.]